MARTKKTAATTDAPATASMVPLEEQVTETGQAPVAVPESAGDAAVASAPVPLPVVDPTLPWAQWPMPDCFTAKLKDLSVNVSEDGGSLTLHGETGDLLGPVNSNALQQLGWNAVFPPDFVTRLTPATQAIVMNERIQNGDRKDKEFTVVLEGGEFANFFPGWRGIAAYPLVAQAAWDTLRDTYGDALTIGDAVHRDGKIFLRLLTPVQETISERRAGDVLQMGIEIVHDYGRHIELGLYVHRLVCTNGMTSRNTEFKWKTRSEGTVDHQLAWLRQNVIDVLPSYQRIVERARVMDQTPINGDPIQALQERARAMRFPRRHLGRLIDAFNTEPDATEWGMLNAFTRVATHDLPAATRRTFQAAAGNWTGEFDLVNARLPRPVAVAAGAEILD